ncbi:MAG TPA: xanthine dehydrogenase family protein molybdopterin-binding subunit, partial [Spirochaetia bacterium]|nr:xanthine dehydrogenase family protein molybdopterin-binding subunit [Spirochaetia bacterium]
MENLRHVGRTILREDALDKVHGRVRFADDLHPPGVLHAALLTSPHAYAEIVEVDLSAAKAAPGVRCVVHGGDLPFRLGIYLGDKPPLARDVVRHHGEPVAAVVADSEAQAQAAVALIKVSYRPLEPIRDPRGAIEAGSPVLHPEMADYSCIPEILPEPGTNIANRTKTRKGDSERGFREAEVTVETECSFPPGDHVAMEPRASIAEINPDGYVHIRSSTQAPFVVRELLNKAFGIPIGKIKVVAPRIGGGFGGKDGLQLEALVYLLSREVGGRPVRLVNTREQDLLSSPGRTGLFARVKLGAKRDGTLTAADLLFLYDSGAYADYAVHISRAGGFSCTGPYRIPNVTSDSLCVYTNHPFATAFRGFGHIEMTYAIERGMEKLAEKLGTDPLELRLKNAIRTGDTSPGNIVFDRNTGDLSACLNKVAERLEWSKGSFEQLSPTKVRAKGIAAFWKAPSIPTFTSAGAILIFNEDGSVNLSTGIVEIGQGTYTGLKQIVAERLRMDPEMVHVVREVSTESSPHDWETAASRSLFMAGRAAIEAVDDAVAQIKKVASAPLRCPEEDLEVADGRAFLRDNPEIGLPLSDVVIHYLYPNGTAIGGPIVGRGKYVARRLTSIDPETGKGRPWLEYTVGSQGVEVEVDLTDGSYRILKAACSMDVGQVVNPQLARGQVVGGMAMSIGYAVSEGFIFDDRERVVNGSLRDLKIMRYGDQPEYFVDFVETPQGDGPYGARGIGEQGILGVPGALAAALSRAIGKSLDRLPLTFEEVWKTMTGGEA